MARVTDLTHLARPASIFYTAPMSISELLPAAHALSDTDKLQLIRILAEDLTDHRESPLDHITGGLPVWTPHGSFDAADTLLAALQADAPRA